MNHRLYRQYLQEYVRRALEDADAGDGSNRAAAEALSTYDTGGKLAVHKEERRRALEDARRAFDDHRHWPRALVLKQLGIDPPAAASSE